MKILDVFRTGSEEEIASILCKLIEKNNWDCTCCPAEAYCYRHHKGFLDILDMDYKDFKEG